MNKFIIAIALMAVGLVGCKDEIIDCVPLLFPGTMKYGWLGAERNGHDYMASVFARRHTDKPTEYFALQFGTINRYFEEQENGSVSTIPLKRGKFTVKRTASEGTGGFPGSYYLTKNDDIPEDWYILDEGEENFIEIISIDSTLSHWIIYGNLQLTFKIGPDPKKDKSNSDVVRFTNGEFEIQLFD